MLTALNIGLFTPLVGFLLLLLQPRRTLTQLIGCGSIGISFLAFVTILFQHQAPISYSLYSWIPIQGIHADFLLVLDPLSILMTLIITGIGFLIHLYSIGYMDHEKDLSRFFACMNFFVFAMLLLVLSGHLLLLFVGWEGVGLASYLLIGFWHERPKAAAAATKAFVMNRIGDLGLLLGLLLTFTLFGTGDIAEVGLKATQQFPHGAPILSLLTLLYFVGSIGKSAQIPLHTWLADAMEGPTPVSALIHAATMVTAGVYLIVRMHTVYLLTPDTLYLVGVVGGVTSLFAAFAAMGQTDLKRVLAFSTVSQLGMMFLACGVGAFYAAMFHLTTHAFVKALLFLSAGNVVHMLHGTTDMAKMGGLKHTLTKTHVLFLIGVLALSGIPPFAAFFSKDLILEEEHEAGLYVLFTIGLAASMLTAFYLTRAYCLTFRGQTQERVKEAPSIMLGPVSVLAFLSIVGGFLGFSFVGRPVLETFLFDIGITQTEQEFSQNLFFSPEMWLALLGAFVGIGSSLYFYKWKPLALFTKAFYIDEVYAFLFVKPLKSFSRFLAFFVEPHIFEGSVTGAGVGAERVARLLQHVQSGEIRTYVALMLFGVAFLMIYFVL